MVTVFVSGVHGVGKTTICSKVAREFGWRHETASGIIKREKASAILDNSKVVQDVNGNQRLLVRGLSKIASGLDVKMILDGHFTLKNKEGDYESVDQSVFAALNIDAFILIIDEPQAILRRINDRDGNSEHSILSVIKHQEAELSHARNLAVGLSKPLKIVEALNDADFLKKLKEFGY